MFRLRTFACFLWFYSRKYSITLEERGYNIGRNCQNHRYYQDKDIITLHRVVSASKSDYA